MKNYLKNYFSTASFIIIWYLFLINNPYYFSFINTQTNIINMNISIMDVFNYLLYFYLIILIPFYFVETWASKARVVLSTIIKKFKDIKYKISSTEKTAILSWIVKLFFLPLMITWLVQNWANMVNTLHFAYLDKQSLWESFLVFFNKHLFFSIYWIIMFLDVMIFAVWYSIESKYLNNVIKSVEPTVIGWIVALLCYPPFNWATWDILWWYWQTFPNFWNPYIHIILNSLILLSFMIYVWASFALWFKASNLTNRWIVEHWPYKFIRHPAYIAKNTARMIWAIPALIIAFKNIEMARIFLIIISSIWRFFIYYLRAMTEEKHLSQDPNYIKYKEKVKYKFIPKIF